VKIYKTIIVSLILFQVMACTMGAHHGEMEYPDYQAPQGDYDHILNHWTDKEKNYNAFSSTFQITATLVSTEIMEHQVYMMAQKSHWTSAQLTEEKQKQLSEAQNVTTCFFSFYTDRDENNNLDKKQTSWNIFLEAGGSRVSPSSIKRVTDGLDNVMQKYPYVTRWTKWYMVKFPISTSVAISGPLTLTVAGPAGDAHLHFPSN
jgi:hypothetical protein